MQLQKNMYKNTIKKKKKKIWLVKYKRHRAYNIPVLKILN